MNTTRQVLTIKQVGEVLQVSTDTVYRLAASGELQGRKIGRIWRIPRRSIEKYMDEHIEGHRIAGAAHRPLSS
ncbi:MAG: helix-turn-helix domain-containing protein [Planctomycetota bacterium]